MSSRLLQYYTKIQNTNLKHILLLRAKNMRKGKRTKKDKRERERKKEKYVELSRNEADCVRDPK